MPEAYFLMEKHWQSCPVTIVNLTFCCPFYPSPLVKQMLFIVGNTYDNIPGKHDFQSIIVSINAWQLFFVVFFNLLYWNLLCLQKVENIIRSFPLSFFIAACIFLCVSLYSFHSLHIFSYETFRERLRPKYILIESFLAFSCSYCHMEHLHFTETKRINV